MSHYRSEKQKYRQQYIRYCSQIFLFIRLFFVAFYNKQIYNQYNIEMCGNTITNIK